MIKFEREFQFMVLGAFCNRYLIPQRTPVIFEGSLLFPPIFLSYDSVRKNSSEIIEISFTFLIEDQTDFVDEE